MLPFKSVKVYWLIASTILFISCNKSATKPTSAAPPKEDKSISSALPTHAYTGPTGFPCTKWANDQTNQLTEVKVQLLHGVFNASGLAVTQTLGTTMVTTANDYDRWHKTTPAPQLFVNSNPQSGIVVGGRSKIGDYRSVEGIAAKDSRFAFLYSPGESKFAITDGVKTISLDTKITAKILSAESRVPAPHQLFMEGLAFSQNGYEVLVTVKHDTGASDDDPRTAMSVRRLWVTSQGQFERMSAPLHWADNRPYNDYGGALDVLSNGLAVVPGFYNQNVHLVAPSGRIVRSLKTPSIRVEGVQWSTHECKLYLVRECVGSGYECDELEPEGVPLWMVSAPAAKTRKTNL